MSKAYDPRLPEDPGIDESEILFDDGDSAPEGVVRAWMKEYRSGRSWPTLLYLRSEDGSLSIVDGRSRYEALKRLGLGGNYGLIECVGPDGDDCPAVEDDT
jgi:hypothetical protein